MPLLLALSIATAGQLSWTVEQKTDPITDKVEVTASLAGDNAKLELMCSRGERPVLVYSPETFLGAAGNRYTRYDLRDMIVRFDSAPPQKESWKYLSDYAVPYNDSATLSLLRGMMSSQRLLLRALRYDGAVVDSSFDLSSPAGLSEAVALCGLVP